MSYPMFVENVFWETELNQPPPAAKAAFLWHLIGTTEVALPRYSPKSGSSSWLVSHSNSKRGDRSIPRAGFGFAFPVFFATR
jgi:hypothetical protein